MSKRNVIMAVLFAVLTVGTIVGVIYGISTHTEPGFTNRGNSWNHVPLRVSCAGFVADRQDDCDLALQATARINERLGFEMFRYLENLDPIVADPNADVRILIGTPAIVGDTTHPNGRTELRGRGTIYDGCEVRTSNTGTDEMLFLVLYHELGCHCLGLAHDDSEQSICRPVQSHTPDGVIPPWISDFDRELLRGKYAL